MECYKAIEDLPTLMTVAELSKLLRISKNQAYALARSTQLKSLRIGRQIRIPKDSLIEFIRSA